MFCVSFFFSRAGVNRKQYFGNNKRKEKPLREESKHERDIKA
jgi:hypothetical protein